MKIVSRNVNGIRAVISKGNHSFFLTNDFDIICLQETKMQMSDQDNFLKNYYFYFSNAKKPGYSGTAVFTKIKPINVYYGINGDYNDEGRIITLEFSDFFLVNAYVPNSKKDLSRIPYRMEFEIKMRNYLNALNTKKHVVYCGDLNVAPEDIDIKNPKNNLRSAGFTLEEREKFKELLNEGYIDTFRFFHPNLIKYSWWSYMFHAREKNAGWRIDHFIVDKDLISKIKDSEILNDIYGSDHCPIILEFK
ncbi:MAG: exodeoxyribonuclease III [Candidatus Onthovivens sp.]|nr:exodeoxyribonuclease III [Candidatus Onthovivens sp.]